VTVTLSQPTDGSANADVTLDTDPGTTGDQNSLSFTASDWDDPQTVTVSAADDDDAAADSATINLTAAGGDYQGKTGSLTVSVDDDDEIALILSATSLDVAEGGDATFKVALDSVPTASVTVTLAQPSNTDVTVEDTDSGTPGSQNTLTFTTANWRDAQTVRVSAAEDSDSDRETATISLTAAGGGYDSAAGSVTVDVADNDIGLDLSVMSLAVDENGSKGFTVKLNTRPSAPVMVRLGQPGGSENTDVSFSPTALNFSTGSWSTIQTVTVRAADDDDALTDTATIELAASGGDYAGVTDRVSVTVTENDTAELKISKPRLDVNEEGVATFTVQLKTKPSDDVMVRLSQPTDGTANTDVTFDTDPDTADDQNSLSFTVSDWDDPQTVTVSAADDDDAADETATIDLTASGGDYQGRTGSLTVSVDDNDEIALILSATTLDVTEGGTSTFTVKLDSVPTAGVTVTLAQPSNTDVRVEDTDSGAPGSQNTLTFTSANWRDAQTVTVSAAEDGDEDSETATISLTAARGGYDSAAASVAVDVTDNDKGLDLSAASLHVTEGSSRTFTVKLISRPLTTVTVALSQPDDDTNTDVRFSPTSLTFMTDDWGTIQTVTVRAAGDDDAVDDRATIDLTASGGNYAGIKRSVRVGVDDDDIAELSLSEARLDVDEADSATFTVRLTSEPSARVTVALSQPDNTDVTVDETSLTFTAANWEDPQTVTVRAADDDDAADDTAMVRLAAAGGDYEGKAGSLTVKVDDNDRSDLVLTPASLTVKEGASSTFTVQLEARPSASVTVTLSQPDNTDVTVDETSLTFTTDNWKDPQIVTVRTAEDDADFDDETAVIDLTAAGGGYDSAASAASVAVDVTDNDKGLDLSVAALDVREGGSKTFMVKLNSRPSATVTVTLSQPSDSRNSDVSFSPLPLIFTTTSWGTTQAVTVNTVDDRDAVEDTATIELTASGGDYTGIIRRLPVTVTERDAAGFGLSESDGMLDLGETKSATFTVRLTSEPLDDVMVTLSQPDDGAANDDVTVDTDPDMADDQNSLSFTTIDWDIAQTVTVSAADDDDADNDITIINLSASGGGYAGKTGSLTVRVDDDDEIELVFSQSTVEVNEGSSASFTVVLGSVPSGNVTVTLVQPGNIDVMVDDTSLTFTTANWKEAQTVTVNAVEDDDSDNDTATLSFTAAGGGYGGVSAGVTVNVTDNDIGLYLPTTLAVPENGSQVFGVRLKTLPSATVTVDLVQSRDRFNSDVRFSPTSLTFMADDWSRSKIVTVSAADDADAVQDTAIIELTASGGDYAGVEGSVEVSVTENHTARLMTSRAGVDVDEEDAATFTVRLTSEPSDDVQVMLSQPTDGAANDDVTFDTDAVAGGDQNTLMFTTANWEDPQTVTVRAADDDDVDDDAATIELTAAGGDYEGVTGSLMVMVDDNDMLRLVLTPESLTVNEGGSSAFTVQLDAPPRGDVMVALVQGGTANNEVSFTPASLDFTTDNWKDPQTVTVSAAQDADVDEDTAAISLTASGGGYDGVSGSMTVTVDDDDIPQLIFTPALLTVDEGASGTFRARLDLRPSGAVTVNLTSDNDDVTIDTDPDTSGNQTALSFTAGSDGNWGADQAVTVIAADDSDDIDDSAVIRLSGTGFMNTSLTVTVADDDRGATLKQQQEAAALQLATIAANLMPASSSTIALRFDAPRGGRTATVAGRQVALDRSLAQDLVAGFAGRTGAQDASQRRFAEDRFGAERHSGDWLGGVRLENGRPLRSGAGASSSPPSGRGALLSSFSYALGAGSDWSVWGRVDAGEFSGAGDGVEFDGAQSSAWLGFDRRTDRGNLSGVAYSSSSSDSDYTLAHLGASIETDMIIVMPYMEFEGGRRGGRGHIMLGLADGDATLNQTDRLQGSADLSMYMVVAGGSWPATRLGGSTLSWSGDFGYTSLRTSGSALAPLNGLSVSSMQLKSGMELAFADIGSSWSTTPRAALLMRLDIGDGITGAGVELTGGLKMTSVHSGRFSVDVNLRTLVVHSAEELSDWGASIQLRLNSHSGGRGFGFALGPHWGAPDGDGLLERDEAFRLDEADRQSRQVRGQDRGLAGSLGYGLRAFGGMLTPYTEYRFTSGSGGSIRQVAGVRFSDGGALELSLFSERQIIHRGEASSNLAIELRRRY
ncbi:MAG: hypothetical protein ISN29_11445, partial [Gammaproteobacteria bacterium AqS3]|nr:hypothetical protein [Gammaproteobacteria bacterium AqS3]